MCGGNLTGHNKAEQNDNRVSKTGLRAAIIGHCVLTIIIFVRKHVLKLKVL